MTAAEGPGEPHRQRSIVFGSGGGIGRALVARLAASGRFAEVMAGSRRTQDDLPSGVRSFRFDLENEPSIARIAEAIEKPLDLVLVATGILQAPELGIRPEKSVRAIDPSALSRTFAVNTIGPALIAKHFLPLLDRHRRTIFAVLSARVGSIADNRLGGWHGYRASKAALNMLIANFAIEMARSHPQAIVAALHPGTVATPLSAPFQRNVAADRIFSPDVAAGHLLAVVDRLTPADSGGLFAWDGARVPW